MSLSYCEYTVFCYRVVHIYIDCFGMFSGNATPETQVVHCISHAAAAAAVLYNIYCVSMNYTRVNLRRYGGEYLSSPMRL